MQLRGRGLEGMLGPGGIIHRRHARAAGAQLGPANWALMIMQLMLVMCR